MNAYLEMWKHSKIVESVLLPKYKVIMDRQSKNHTAKLTKNEERIIEKALLESILKGKNVNLALLDPFDDTYISGVVVHLSKEEITLRNNSELVYIPVHLIIGVL